MNWWRRNRWALLAFPVVLLLALAASSDLVKPYWYDKGFHHGTVSKTATAHVVNHYDDGHLTYTGRGTVTVTGWSSFSRKELAGRGSAASSVQLPPHTRAWGFGLRFRAKPSQVLWGCHYGVVGNDGRFYPLNGVTAPMAPSNIYGCDPDDSPGPQPAVGKPKLEQPASPRPGTWRKYAFGTVPDDVTPVRLRIWWSWGLPRHFDIPLTKATRR